MHSRSHIFDDSIGMSSGSRMLFMLLEMHGLALNQRTTHLQLLLKLKKLVLQKLSTPSFRSCLRKPVQTCRIVRQTNLTVILLTAAFQRTTPWHGG
ncbi:hypothetical protein BT96DRAFT_619021 [Gymnopus androsaceus JB14]|uniref:Uncharacterized protein n=1 Tax=Gymnopus androsaceus JB14 TaxID=1447944 RepID=A0A6A4GGY1_9AGAR|nr:hypothetical protein BT96DRAFT_619021 [Gymnopus androsaceus JB14]